MSKERPILMSAPMVRALLAGTKTQTRRVVKPQPDPCMVRNGDLYRHPRKLNDYAGEVEHVLSPYGQPSDKLWCREAWAEVGNMDPGLIVYRADYPACVPRQYENVPPADEITWKPSIHMRRKDSRINLEITGIRVERLQDISGEDAIAEGYGNDGCEGNSAYRWYRTIWESINGPGSWDANPWVWVVEFKRIEP